MATNNSANQDYQNNADGWQLGGGTTKRTLTVSGGSPTISGGAATLTLAGNFSTSGSNPITLTSTGSTTVTLPTSGTLATLAGTETLTNKTINASNNTVTNVSLTTAVTGTLPLANGGTNATTASAARTSLAVPEASGFAKIHVGTSAPGSPATGDLWVDTN